LTVFAVLVAAEDQPTDPAAAKPKDDNIVLPDIVPRTYIPDDNGPCAKNCKGYQLQPLCAYDQHENVLRSFQNVCDLQVGECYAARIYIVISYEEECELACPKYCPPEHNEVCGSDNVTYKNPCRMKQSACKLRTRLAFQNWGRCKRDKLVFPTKHLKYE
jgi:hypothetical protein